MLSIFPCDHWYYDNTSVNEHNYSWAKEKSALTERKAALSLRMSGFFDSCHVVSLATLYETRKVTCFYVTLLWHKHALVCLQIEGLYKTGGFDEAIP